MSLEKNGTAANETAINVATGYDLSKCLFGMGSYAGGCGGMLLFSSSKVETDHTVSLPAKPLDVAVICRRQTVPLPYWVECNANSTNEQTAMEDACLSQLRKRLFTAKLAGKPFTAFLLEIILGGCGAMLSDRFLSLFGPLMLDFEVQVIVDECMTAGRVGPQLTMTTRTPTSFENSVGYITMAKFPNCGLIVEKTPNKPTQNTGLRGTSTEIDAGEAFYCIRQADERLKRGVYKNRHRAVVLALSLKDKEQVWGQGGLIFVSRTRTAVVKGLKNRCLPMLESRKINVGSRSNSIWTRSAVNAVMIDRFKLWMSNMETCSEMQWPFLGPVIQCLSNPELRYLTPAIVEESIGEKKAGQIATLLRTKRQMEHAALGGSCNKKAKTFIREVLDCATVNVPALLVKKRIGRKRQLVYEIIRSD